MNKKYQFELKVETLEFWNKPGNTSGLVTTEFVLFLVKTKKNKSRAQNWQHTLV